MSIAEYQRLKLLEQIVLELRERIEALERKAPVPVEKRGPGRPPKAQDAH